MPQLPTDAIPAANFLLRQLYRSIDVSAGSRYFAVAETQGPGADAWFWNDDNAKVLELLSRPEVWRQFRQETAEVLRFVRSMCRGPFIFRRVSAPRLDLVSSSDGIASYRHSLMSLRHIPAQAAVVAGVRFHDERSGDNLMLCDNYVEFSYRGRRFKRLVPSRGSAHAEQDGHLLRLRHSAELHFTPGWQRRRLGTIAYTYTFDAMSMLFEVEAVLELDPGITVGDVVLTIGHGNLGYCFFDNIVTDRSVDGTVLFKANAPSVGAVDAAGGSYYAIRQGHISGDALAVHSVPRGPQPLAGIETVVETRGRLDRVLARYQFPGRHQGGRLVAAEHKLITAGGFYERVADYAAFVREASTAKGTRQAAYDFSISYDYGVTLNAFAKCFAVASSEPDLLGKASDIDELRGLFDQTLDHYFALYVDRHEARPNGIFSRELAFAMLATTTMQRATGSDEYRRRLTRMLDVLLDFEMRFDDDIGLPASSFLMRKNSPRASYVDCHSGALLALTQAARVITDPRLATVIDRGLASYGLETARVAYGAMTDTVSVLMVDENGGRHCENAFWNFKAGITLRFFNALRGSEDAALRAVAARHQDRMRLLETVMRRQLEQSLSEHDDGVEIRCSLNSGETNSESQPWAMLGLVGHPCD